MQLSSRAVAGLLTQARTCGPVALGFLVWLGLPTVLQPLCSYLLQPLCSYLLCQHVREAGCSDHILFSSAS